MATDKFPGLDLEQVQDPVARRNFRVIERILLRSTIGSNPLGSTGVTNIGGSGGGGAGINQVHENQFIGQSELGLLPFGKGAEDSLAHAISVTGDGELRLAEFPPVMLSATGISRSTPFGFPFATQIFTAPRAAREEYGSAPTNWSTMNVGQFHDFNLGSSSLDSAAASDVGVLTMDSPKVNARAFDEFGGDYYSGGTPGVAKAMTSGSHDSGAILGVFRFRKGVLTFKTEITGSPTDVMRILLIGIPTNTLSPNGVILKTWHFDADTWIGDSSFPGQALHFDIETPYIALSIIAVGGTNDVSNHYTITGSSIYFNLYS